VPATIDQLPGVLHTECTNLATAYQPPGALLLAYHHDEPIACVGLEPMPPAGTIEVKRLYVRPTHRLGCRSASSRDRGPRRTSARLWCYR
jgi:hypothetical protein